MSGNLTKPHKRLNAWNKAIDLTVDIYKLTDTLPKTEIYGLSGQMRRASISAASNIAEGAGRQTKKEFINYLHIAQGSLSELDTQLIIANRIEYITSDVCNEMENKIETISKMITGLIKSLKR
jgi:four helix bundle protein